MLKITNLCHKEMLRGSLGSALGVGIRMIPWSEVSWTVPSCFLAIESVVAIGRNLTCSSVEEGFISCMVGMAARSFLEVLNRNERIAWKGT